jgi:hypothetical protein
MTAEQLAAERARARDQVAAPAPAVAAAAPRSRLALVPVWTVIALPLAWGVWVTVTKSLPLFR